MDSHCNNVEIACDHNCTRVSIRRAEIHTNIASAGGRSARTAPTFLISFCQKRIGNGGSSLVAVESERPKHAWLMLCFSIIFACVYMRMLSLSLSNARGVCACWLQIGLAQGGPDTTHNIPRNHFETRRAFVMESAGILCSHPFFIIYSPERRNIKKARALDSCATAAL